MQAGSSVTSDSFRFDFTHNAPLTPDQVAEVERWVNAVATENDSVKVEEVALEDAKVRTPVPGTTLVGITITIHPTRRPCVV